MNINAFAIINADNDTIARYGTLEEATAELAYFTEDYCVVDWFAFFHHVPAARLEDRIQSARTLSDSGCHGDALELAVSLTEFGITCTQIFA